MKILVCQLLFLSSVLSFGQIKNDQINKKMEISVPVVNGQIDLLTDIPYTQVINQRSVKTLKMSMLVPRDNKLKPAIVYFPGGGFISADYDKFFEMKSALAKAGYVVAGAEYRVIPDEFPALVNDAKSAVRYLRAHAEEYGIDPDRIGVLGDSAGGYLAQFTGASNGEKEFDKGDYLNFSSAVQSVVSLYGISDLRNIGEGFSKEIQAVHQSPAVTEALLVNGPAFATFPGASILSDNKKALNASPIGHVKSGLPPFLLMHGSADKLVSPEQSNQMYNSLLKANNKAEYIIVKDSGHGSIEWYQPKVIQLVVEWFKNTLGEPKETTIKKVNDNL